MSAPLLPASCSAALALLHASIIAASDEIGERRVELACFESLRAQEGLARPQRLQSIEAFVVEQREREASLQERYSELQRTKLTLLEALGAK